MKIFAWLKELLLSIWTPSTSTGGGPWLPGGVNQVTRAPVVTPPPTVNPTPQPLPVNTALPVITGVAQSGQVLTVSDGQWDNANSFTYQWSSGGADVPGAIANSYTQTGADVGNQIDCSVAALNAFTTIGVVAIALPVGPVLPLAPSNTVAPIISGTATQGQTLTVTSDGTWTNGTTGFAQQWYSNTVSSTSGGTPITGEMAASYVQSGAVLGLYIYCQITATNAGGTGTALSNVLGPVASASGLATPTLTNFSTLGATPVVLEWSTTDYVAGDYAQLEVASDSGFVTITQNIIFFIDGVSWTLADESIGLTLTAGQTYYSRIRTLRENESGATAVTGFDPKGNALSFNADASAFSTTFTDTI